MRWTGGHSIDTIVAVESDFFLLRVTANKLTPHTYIYHCILGHGWQLECDVCSASGVGLKDLQRIPEGSSSQRMSRYR